MDNSLNEPASLELIERIDGDQICVASNETVSPQLFEEFNLEPLPDEIEVTSECSIQYGDNIKFPWSGKMDLKHWMQVMVQVYINAPNGNKVLYSELDLSQQPILKSRSETALGKRGQQRSTLLERLPSKRKRFEYSPGDISAKKRSGAPAEASLSSRCFTLVSMFGDATAAQNIPNSSHSLLVHLPISEFESSLTDVNPFEKFLTAQSESSPVLYFDLLSNTVAFATEYILHCWNSRVHRLLTSTLCIYSTASASQPSALLSAFPLSHFVELYRIVSEHSLPLADQIHSFFLDDVEASQSSQPPPPVMITSIYKLLQSALAYCIALMELPLEKTGNGKCEFRKKKIYS